MTSGTEPGFSLQILKKRSKQPKREIILTEYKFIIF